MKIITYALIVFSTLCTLGAQLILKNVVSHPSAKSAMGTGVISFLETTLSHPLTWLALVLQGTGYISWLIVISREKLAVSFALSGSTFYLLTAFSAWYFYSERLTAYQWTGIIFISFGVLLIAYHGR